MAFGKYISFLKNTLSTDGNNKFLCFKNDNSVYNITQDHLQNIINIKQNNSLYNSLFNNIITKLNSNLTLYNNIINNSNINNDALKIFYDTYHIQKIEQELADINTNQENIINEINSFSDKLMQLSANIDNSFRYFDHINIIKPETFDELLTNINTISTLYQQLSNDTNTSVSLSSNQIKDFSTKQETFQTNNTKCINNIQTTFNNVDYIPNAISDYLISTCLVYNGQVELSAIDIINITKEHVYNNIEREFGFDSNIMNIIQQDYDVQYINSNMTINPDTQTDTDKEALKSYIYMPEYTDNKTKINFNALSVYIRNIITSDTILVDTGRKDPETGETKYEPQNSNGLLYEYNLSVAFALIRNVISVNID